jgi:hypothetical protein
VTDSAVVSRMKASAGTRPMRIEAAPGSSLLGRR